MTLGLYENKSDEKVVNKSITQLETYEGFLKASSSITNPVIQIEGVFNIYNNGNVNYMYLPDYRRFYYITDIIQIRANLVEIHGRVDVLMSFKDELKSCKGILRKGENNYNMYLDDGSLKVFQNKQLQMLKFPSGFPSENFILVMAGG